MRERPTPCRKGRTPSGCGYQVVLKDRSGTAPGLLGARIVEAVRAGPGAAASLPVVAHCLRSDRTSPSKKGNLVVEDKPIVCQIRAPAPFWSTKAARARNHRPSNVPSGGLSARVVRRLHFTTAATLVHELIEARDEKRLLRLQQQLAKVKLLIIDELGFVPLSKSGAELLFEIFSQRYERGSILVTSNLPFEDWTEVFGSERLTGALLDLLTHHVHILEMKGESYRLNQNKRRQRRRNKASASSPQPQ